MTELPLGWVLTTVADVCEVILGQSPPGSAYNSDGLGHPFFQGKAEFGDLYPTTRKWATEGNKRAAAGDVLASVRAPVGPTNLAPGDCIIGRGLAAVRPSCATSAKFVLYQLRATEGSLAAKGTGSTFTAISGPQLRSHPFVLPPLPEQERIVAAVEEQFSRLDHCAVSLMSGRRKAEQLIAALMHRITAAPGVELSELLTEPLANGRSVPTADHGFPVLRLTALRNGRIDLRERKIGAWTRAEADRFLARAGDFFISRGNGSLLLVGRGALLDTEPDEVAYPDTMIRARVDQARIAPQFLRLAWNSEVVRRQIEATARTTAGIYKVNQQDLARVRVPLPSIDQQERLVAEAECQISIIDSLNTAINKVFTWSEHLRRSILQRAFSGRLVPQDPTDEPACELLKRIEHERGQLTKPRRARRTHVGTVKS